MVIVSGQPEATSKDDDLKLAIMQPYFFPYLAYYQLLDAADILVVLDDVAYINRGWINRNYILLNGGPHLFTVPLNKASQNRLIKDIETAELGTWKAKFLKLLTHAYARAPWFPAVYSQIDNLISVEKQKISRLAGESIGLVRDMLGLKTEVVYASDLEYNCALKGQDKIIEICALLGATTYVNPIGGVGLYRVREFEEKGIELRFLKTPGVRYIQFAEGQFVSNLSMIDVLMFNTRQSLEGLLGQYCLVAQGEA